VDRAEALIARGHGNERECAHVAAARAWLEGNFEEATDRYNRIALEYPRDMLALQVSHLCNFFVGRATFLRDTVAAALPHHQSTEASRGYLLGMWAFGLEECGEFQRAEEAGLRALAQNPRDPWAVHAVAHCHELQGAAAVGARWLEERVQDWAPDNFFAGHNYWHLAVFELALGEHTRVLDRYDRDIRGTQSEVVLGLVDASSLLWRLWLAGVDVKERFAELAKVYRRVEEEGYYAFNDFHAIMAYAGAGAADDVARVLSGLERAARQSGSNASFSRDVSLPVCRAFAAFAAGEYGLTVDALFGLRGHAQRFGGSNAQRDVLDLTLIAAAQRSGQHGLARGLLSARAARKGGTAAATLPGYAASTGSLAAHDGGELLRGRDI
jgi:tetratricopeptide (TPR) repeat protein